MKKGALIYVYAIIFLYLCTLKLKKLTLNAEY